MPFVQAAAHGEQAPSSGPLLRQEAPAAVSAPSVELPGSSATQVAAPAALPAAVNDTAAVVPVMQSNAEGTRPAGQTQDGLQADVQQGGSNVVNGALQQSESVVT